MTCILPIDGLSAKTASPCGIATLAQPCFQKTLRKEVKCSGVGVHSGDRVTLRLCPAEENTGIVFIRTDLVNGARTIDARWDNVVDTRLCTTIGNDHGGKVSTVEHLMAALSANGIDNARIEIDGPEVPIMDGSADSFMFLLDMAGTIDLDAPKREIEILSPVEIATDGKLARLLPCEETRFSVTIDFDRAPIYKQSCDIALSPATFKSEISRARTFGFYEEVEQLQKMGLARGGSLSNSIIIKDKGVLNMDGLRFENEFARHKTLDAIGDIALAGLSIRGRFDGYKTGHDLNNKLLKKLFATQSAWQIVGMDAPAPLPAV